MARSRYLIAMAAAAAVVAAVTPAAAPTTPTPVALIFMENQAFERIIGNGDAPFINQMWASGFDGTSFFAITPGSKWNYLGTTSGVNLKGTPGPYDVDNIFHQLAGVGLSQRSYEETIPRNCFTRSKSGTAPQQYVKPHDPEVNYSDIVNDTALCRASIVGLDATDTTTPTLASDLAAGALPAFSFVTPNNCNNMHSCSIATGDQFLAAWVPQLVDAGADVILTWDEGVPGDEHIVLTMVGTNVVPGTWDPTGKENGYNVLAGLEDHFGLPRLGAAVGAAPFPIP